MPLLELNEVLFARGYAYDILRRIFVEEPTQDYLKVLMQQKMIEQFPFIEESEGIQEGVREVIEYLQQVDVVNNLSHFDNLHWDYTRMFIGPFELPVPPWESLYVRKDKLLFQGNTMNVRKKFEKFGFKVSENNIEAEDHVGLELDFMYHLNQLCIESVENKKINEVQYLLSAQSDFITKHLNAFVPALSRKVMENAETPFYSGMAKILKNYLDVDSQVLKELLNIDIH